MRKVTSIYMEEDILRKLKLMDVNVSDMTNFLFSKWLKHMKENDLMDKIIEEATAAYFLQQIKKKVYEK